MTNFGPLSAASHIWFPYIDTKINIVAIGSKMVNNIFKCVKSWTLAAKSHKKTLFDMRYPVKLKIEKSKNGSIGLIGSRNWPLISKWFFSCICNFDFVFADNCNTHTQRRYSSVLIFNMIIINRHLCIKWYQSHWQHSLNARVVFLE